MNLEGLFPSHVCGLSLDHNAHKNVYESIEQYYDKDCFVSPGGFNKAVCDDNVWSLQWYPDTPVGFYQVCASSLELLLDAVKTGGWE